MKKFIALALLLTACGNNNPAGRIDPLPGQWVTYGTGSGYAGKLANPFAVPKKPVSVNYVYTAAAPLPIGKQITLTYSLIGDGVLGVADSADVLPPTIALFLWRANDSGSEFGRWWCPTRPELKFGLNQILSCPTTGWTSVFGKADAAQFTAALNHPFAVGFTFGGKYFSGHGVWVTSGQVTFKVESFAIN